MESICGDNEKSIIIKKAPIIEGCTIFLALIYAQIKKTNDSLVQIA